MMMRPNPVLAEDTPAPGKSSNPTERSFEGFAAARNEILSLISSATGHIQIVTDFLSDGDIASALYIAQYRKVEVQVLLGPAKATSILSRLNFLKSQQIPVWLRPKNFMASYPTIIRIDQTLYGFNADLDYLARHRKFTLVALPSGQMPAFIEDFQQAANSSITPEARPLPLVGRPGSRPSGRGARQTQQQGAREAYNGASPYAEREAGGYNTNDGTYKYQRKKERPSNGIPTKLPRTTILQERNRGAGPNDIP